MVEATVLENVKRLTKIADYLSARYSFLERTNLKSVYIQNKVNRDLNDIISEYDNQPNFEDYNRVMKAYADGTEEAEQIIEKIYALRIMSM